MTPAPPERREGAVELAAAAVRVRAGFRAGPGELLAGGPVELEFFVESVGTRPLRLAVSGDRARGRPGQLDFTAMFAGAPLADPLADLPDLGGPAGVVEVAGGGTPWRQPLVLNQFLRLEDTPGRLAPGATGRLALTCRRPLPLAATDDAALADAGAPVLAVDLALDLRRDDAALAARVAGLLDEVRNGPPASRERALSLLLSLRSAARAQIEELARHPDPSLAGRARHALATAV